jgi:hypothetical protein
MPACSTIPGTGVWSPYVGCPETELYENWGHGGNRSEYDTGYGVIINTWYNKNVYFGFILPGYSSNSFSKNILISIDNKQIRRISYF